MNIKEALALGIMNEFEWDDIKHLGKKVVDHVTNNDPEHKAQMAGYAANLAKSRGSDHEIDYKKGVVDKISKAASENSGSLAARGLVANAESNKRIDDAIKVLK